MIRKARLLLAVGKLLHVLLLSSTLSLALLLAFVGTALAQAFSCEELRPIRGKEFAIDGNIKAGAGVIVKKIIGGDVDVSGKVKYKEMFPDMFGHDLVDIERFYYMLCLALSDESIEAELRVRMFMQAAREQRMDFERHLMIKSHLKTPALTHKQLR